MKKGFTIVELLIVVVVVGILAAITIVGYNAVTKNAVETSLKSDLRNTASKLALSKVNGKYPITLESANKAQSGDNKLIYTSNGSSYCISAVNTKNPALTFNVTQAETIASGLCSPATVAQLSAANSFSFALGSNGRVTSWGLNNQGQLAQGHTVVTNPSPVLLPASAFGNKIITQLDTGHFHGAAVALDGTVYTWGLNANNELGDGTIINRTSPVALPSSAFGGKTITQVQTGTNRTMALASDGTVFGWGDNTAGQLGDGTATKRTSPTAIPASSFGGKKITQLSAHHGHNLALAADGSVYAWGSGSYGKLGDGTTNNRLSPVMLSAGAFGGKTIIQLDNGAAYSFALASDGTVFAWGFGDLGDGTSLRSSPGALPGSAFGGKKVTQISVGDNHALARTSDGTVYAWGNNDNGQLGDNTYNTRATPVVMAGSAVAGPVVMVEAGSIHSLAFTEGGRWLAWGSNVNGQLGDETTDDSPGWVDVSYPGF